MGTEVSHRFQAIPEDCYLVMRKCSRSVVVKDDVNVYVCFGQVCVAEAVFLEAVHSQDLCHNKQVNEMGSIEVEEDDHRLQDHDPEVSF